MIGRQRNGASWWALVAAVTVVLATAVMPVLAQVPEVWVATTGDDATGAGTSGNPYFTIQKGIETVDASGTVHIAAGTYSDTSGGIVWDGARRYLVISKPLTLQGAGSGLTILDAEHTYSVLNPGCGPHCTVVWNEAQDVTIRGMTVQKGDYGIRNTTVDVGGSLNSLVLDDVVVTDNYGIGVVFEDNITTVTMTDCEANNSGDFGIYFPGTTTAAKVTLTNTSANGNGHVGFSCQGSIADLSITGGTFNDNSGGLFQTNCTTQLGPYYGFGIELGNCVGVVENVTAHGNGFEGPTIVGGIYGDEGGAGIVVKDGSKLANDIQIFDADLQNNMNGLWIEDPDSVANWSATFTGTVTVRLSNITDNQEFGALNCTDPATVVLAEDNWWGDDSGPYHATANASGLGDEVSDNVDFDPWTSAGIAESTTETVTVTGTVVSTPSGGAAVEVTGTAQVTVAEYDGNPTGSGFGTSEVGYIDVYVPDTSSVTEIEIRLYYAVGTETTTLKLSWWDGIAWVECSNQGVNTTDGYLWAIITATTVPSLTELQGTIFGGGSGFPPSTLWYEDFEYADQAAMTTAGWVFGTNGENLWHLATEASVPASVYGYNGYYYYGNLIPFPSSNHAAWFGNPSTGTYGSGSTNGASVSPQDRAARSRIYPKGAGKGYPYGELTSPGILVEGQSAVNVNFSLYREVECYQPGQYDQTYVQVSFDGGPWQKVLSLDSQYCYGAYWSSGWDPYYSVAVPVGAKNMQIRFVFDAVDNEANNYLGWLIDDLQVSSAGPAGLRFEEESLPEGLVGHAYSATIYAVGGTVGADGYSWRVVSNDASGWLHVAYDATGTEAALSGTPADSGSYSLCIGVSDDRGETYSTCYTIVVEEMVAGGELFYDDFEGAADGWTTDGLWHLTENVPCVSPAYASPTHVYYYGKDATCNYASGGTSGNNGTLTSDAIPFSGLVAGSKLTIGWKYWREVEAYVGEFDRSWVEYKFDNGGWTQIWYDDSHQSQPMGGWHLVEFTDVAVPFGATSLQIRFSFNTIDGYANNFVGWLIDDVKVIQQVEGLGPLAITTTCPLPGGTEGQSYGPIQLQASGGTGSYTWTATGLPTALTCTVAGVVSGTPGANTAGGSPYSVTLKVTDSATNTISKPCNLTIAAAPVCPCDLASLNFENALIDQTLTLPWTVTGLWHVAANGCANCGGSGNHYGYFGVDASCDYNTGGVVTGYLTSPEVPLASCIQNLAIGFKHYREVEAYQGSYDRTSVQVRWNTGAWGAWQTIWLKDANNPSLDNCLDVVIGPVPVPAGATKVQVRFGFESVDALFNDFTGWAVDAIWVKNYTCAPAPTLGPLSVSALQVKDVSRSEITVLNVPNPVRDVHTTTFSVRGVGIEVEATRIQIFDINQNLVFEEEVAGTELVWHTVNEYGEYLANGVYFYRALVLAGGEWIATAFQKLVILR